MQNALTPTGALCRARIMSGRMEGKQRKAARIPTTDTMTGRTFGIFLNIRLDKHKRMRHIPTSVRTVVSKQDCRMLPPTSHVHHQH